MKRELSKSAGLKAGMATSAKHAAGEHSVALVAVKPLPGILIFPNLEVVLINFFAGGITEAAAAVVSGAASGVVLDGATLAIAIICLCCVVLFYLHELMVRS